MYLVYCQSMSGTFTTTVLVLMAVSATLAAISTALKRLAGFFIFNHASNY
ncbi:hypothetical protein EUBVEN_01361 [Eubacterium ventriosum ATCC 27560]|uniref:Uncharacterized protein n=1 Tax=Eubacterium ventriosum ATCC 27560 TaxID=411463 RepID=A5Z6M8_9FIRM|nr:hypothetical protein EUBVEN_01361 [Eubacterium ventriosum ATCC 27560]